MYVGGKSANKVLMKIKVMLNCLGNSIFNEKIEKQRNLDLLVLERI